MKIKGLLIALAVLALAVAGYFVATGLVRRAEEAEAAETSSRRLVDAEPADINKIVYSYQGQTYEFILDEDGETWIYPADPDFPLKQRLVVKMANSVDDIISVQEIDPQAAADLAQYGLAEPQCVLALYTADGRSYQFNIGNFSELPRGYYVQPAGSDTVHLVKSDIEDYLLSLFDLATQDSLPYVMSSNISRLEIRDPESGSYAYDRWPDGNPDYYNSATTWFADTEDGVLVAGDNTKFREFISNINAMEVKACAFYPYSQADLSQFGLEDGGRGGFTIQYYDENAGEDRVYTLEIGDPAPEQDGYYTYVHINDSQMICTIKTADLEEYVFCGEDYFRSKDVCVVDYESILEMDLTIDGESYHFTSTKEETVDQFGYDVTLSTFYLDGEEVNSEYFRVLQSAFSTIDAEAFADDWADFADAEPYIRIVYTTDSLDHAVLEFVPYNANFYLARFGGRSDMLVGRQTLRTAADRLNNLLDSMEGEAAAG